MQYMALSGQDSEEQMWNKPEFRLKPKVRLAPNILILGSMTKRFGWRRALRGVSQHRRSVLASHLAGLRSNLAVGIIESKKLSFMTGLECPYQVTRLFLEVHLLEMMRRSKFWRNSQSFSQRITAEEAFSVELEINVRSDWVLVSYW